MDDDVALLDAARRMDGEALARIFDLYAPALYHYALRFCQDAIQAENIVGDVFAKLLEKLSGGNGPRANLRSYLFESTYHQFLDEIRHSNRKLSLHVVDLLPYDRNSVYESLENRILFEWISQVLQNDLTDYQRHVIILRFMEGFSLYETGAILGKSAKHVKAAQNRAMVKLRKAFHYKTVDNKLVGVPAFSERQIVEVPQNRQSIFSS